MNVGIFKKKIMKLVKLVDDNWKPKKNYHRFGLMWAQKVRKVGDPLPEKGNVYTVKDEVRLIDFKNAKESNKIVSYSLEEFDYSAYDRTKTTHTKNGKTVVKHTAGFFRADRFEVVSNEFVPNAVTSDGQVCEEVSLIVSFKNASKSLNQFLLQKAYELQTTQKP